MVLPSIKVSNALVSELLPYANNAREHTDEQVAQVAASITEFGWTNPIIIHGQTVVAGHARLAAARKLGLTEVPVIDRSDMSKAQWKAYVLADNQLAQNATWNNGLLALELDNLQALDFDLDLLGFGDDLAGLLGDEHEEGLTDPDDVPEPPEEPITQPGDLWMLGDHRLLCGDSTDAESVAYLMDGAKADLWLTDPPYNVDYTGKTKDALKVSNDSMADDQFRTFLVDAFSSAMGVLKPGASFYIWHADLEGYNFRGAIHDIKQQVRQCLIWKKQTMVMGRQDYHWQHEPCLYGWKEGAAHGWYTDRKQTTILEFDRPSRSEEHPTMKPVALFEYQVGNSTAPQGLILDTFLGSGTTLIAAERTGRKCYGLEIDPIYCDVILERYVNFVGSSDGVMLSSTDGTHTYQEVQQMRKASGD